MPKYREDTATAQTWQRAYRIEVDYPYAGNPKATFFEQVAKQIGRDAPVMRDVGTLTVTITPAKMMEEIPLRDPETGNLTGGTTTYFALAQGIFSAYYAEGLARDK